MTIRNHIQINANPIDNGFLLNIKGKRGEQKELINCFCEDEDAVAARVAEALTEWKAQVAEENAAEE